MLLWRNQILSVRSISAAKGPSSIVVMELWLEQPQKKMNTKTSKKEQPKGILDDTTGASPTRPNLPEKLSIVSQLHRLDTVEVVLKQEEVWLVDSDPTANDIH